MWTNDDIIVVGYIDIVSPKNDSFRGVVLLLDRGESCINQGRHDILVIRDMVIIY